MSESHDARSADGSLLRSHLSRDMVFHTFKQTQMSDSARLNDLAGLSDSTRVSDSAGWNGPARLKDVVGLSDSESFYWSE